MKLIGWWPVGLEWTSCNVKNYLNHFSDPVSEKPHVSRMTHKVVNKLRWNILGYRLLEHRNIDGLAMFWDTMDSCMKSLKAEWDINQKSEKKNSNATWFGKWWWFCCTPNGQLRTERDGETEWGCQQPAVQQKTTDVDDELLEQGWIGSDTVVFTSWIKIGSDHQLMMLTLHYCHFQL